MGQIILRLDRVMADRKISLNDLSEKVGVSNVNLSKMKNGKISAIRFSTLEAICEALDCQPGDILEYDKNAPSNRLLNHAKKLPDTRSSGCRHSFVRNLISMVQVFIR